MKMHIKLDQLLDGKIMLENEKRDKNAECHKYIRCAISDIRPGM